MTTYIYNIYVYLPGDTRAHLCTCEDPQGAASIILALCAAAKPGYARIEIEIAPRTG